MRKLDVYPKIFGATTMNTVTFEDTEGTFLKEGATIHIDMYPCDDACNTKVEQFKTAIVNNGKVQTDLYFPTEQEYFVFLYNDDDIENKIQVNLFALNRDLMELRPYKGDFHIHTTGSDGKEDPKFLPAYCRSIGLDFMTITDHGKMQPSREGIAAYDGFDVDMTMFTGEEIHPVKHAVHIVNCNGEFSVNELIQKNENKFLKEVDEICDSIDGMKNGLNSKHSKYISAVATWVFRKVEEANGLAIFAHPYWKVNNGYHIPESVVSYLLNKNALYDAVEGVGGYYRNQSDSNTLQITRYYEERCKGNIFPVVSCSDSHGALDEDGNIGRDLFGWYYTLVFAKSNEFTDIHNAVRQSYCLAVDNSFEGADHTIPYGPFRFIKYGIYLIREIMPEHDRICKLEGDIMLRYINGDEKAKAEYINGEIDKYYNKIYGETQIAE